MSLYVSRSPRETEGLGEEKGGLMVLDDTSKIIYKCGRCGAEFSAAELERMRIIKCLYCGYRVLYKVRPPGSKIVKAI